MKKSILAITMASIMVLSAVSFADAPVSKEGNAIGIRERFVEKREPKFDRKENFKVGLKSIVEKYAPELFSDFEAIWETQKDNHVAQMEELRTEMELIKSRLDEETITHEEARAEVNALREAHQAERDARFSEAFKEDRKAYHEQLKKAIESEDEVLIHEVLSEILESLQDFIDVQ